MKKIIFVAIFVIFIFLPSCTEELNYLDNENPTETTNMNFEYTPGDDSPIKYQRLGINRIECQDGYLYYHDGVTFVRYNPAKNSKTYVCGDPLCFHTDMNCPLYTIMGHDLIHVYDNKLYFTQRYFDFTADKTIYREAAYDIKTGKLTVLNNQNEYVRNNIANRLYYENFVYYYKYDFKDENAVNNAVSSVSDYYAALFKQDLKTGKMIELEKFDDGIYEYPIAGVNGKIYFAVQSEGIFYINANTSDRKIKNYIYTGKLNFDIDTMACDGEYLYYMTHDKEVSKTIYGRMSLDNGTQEELIRTDILEWDYPKHDDSFYLTENYIYYHVCEPKIIGKLPNQAGILDDYAICTNKIYRMKHDGSENTLVFSGFPKGMETYSITNTFVVAGNYIYSEYTNYGELKEIYELSDLHYDSNEIIRININTGEVFCIK